MAFIDVLLETFDTIKLVLIYGWPFIILIWLFALKIKWKKWPVEAIIIEKRGSNLIKTNDRAGRYTDPYTGLTGYRLQKSKDTIPILNYDWVLHNVAVPTTLFERFVNLIRGNIGTIFLFRYGSKQYKPINIKGDKRTKVSYKEMKDNKGKSFFNKIYIPFDPRSKLGVLDFEVIDWDNMNFMVQEQRASIIRRQKKGEFMKQILIPMGIMIITALVCIVMIKFAFDYAVTLKSSPAPTPKEPVTKPNVPVVGDLIPGT